MLVVYTKPACPQCDFTKRRLDELGVPYTVIDLTEDSAAMARVQSLGYSSAPVVLVSPEVHWSGFRPGRLAALRGDAAA